MDFRTLEPLCFLFCVLLFFSCDRSATPLEQEDRGATLASQIETFLTYKQIFGNNDPERVESFDLDSKFLYVHPIGAYGLYQYSFSESTLTELIRYPAGNYIAQDSSFVFYEVSGSNVYRYNLAKNEIDLELDLSGLDFTNIDGLDVYENSVYIFMHSQTTNARFLAQLSLDGALIRTIPIEGSFLHLAIYDHVAYGIYYPDGQHVALSRFDLKSNVFLEDLAFPTENWDGFRVIDGQLYFTDFQKAEILRVPLEALGLFY